MNELVVASGKESPTVNVFAYRTTNINLNFVDLLLGHIGNPTISPSLSCVLNVGIFFFTDKNNNFVFRPNKNTTLNFLSSKEDSLFFFLHLLSLQLKEEGDTTTDMLKNLILPNYSSKVKRSNLIKMLLKIYKMVIFENMFVEKLLNGLVVSLWSQYIKNSYI